MKKPMQIEWEQTSYWRHHQKIVNADRQLDDMNDSSHWQLRGHVAPDNIEQFSSWKEPCGTMTFTQRDGLPVARMHSPTTTDTPNPAKGRGWGVTTLYRPFNHED